MEQRLLKPAGYPWEGCLMMLIDDHVRTPAPVRAEAALLRAVMPASRVAHASYIPFARPETPAAPCATRTGSCAGRAVLRIPGVTLPCNPAWRRTSARKKRL